MVIKAKLAKKHNTRKKLSFVTKKIFLENCLTLKNVCVFVAMLFYAFILNCNKK